MCPTQDDHQYQHHPQQAPLNLHESHERSHSTASAVDEGGFSVWRGRRIRRDVGSWPCDTIELEVCLLPFTFRVE